MAGGLKTFWRPGSGAGRRVTLAMVAAGVAGVHGCVADALVARMPGLSGDRQGPVRIEVVYVREMALAPPPPTANPAAPPGAVAAPPSGRLRAVPPARAASTPDAPRAERVAAAPPPAEAEQESQAEAMRNAETPRRAATDAVSASATAGPAEIEAEIEAFSDPPPPTIAQLEAMSRAASAGQGTDSAAVASASAASSADAGAGAASGAGSADATGFQWPASTRLSYELTGNYRGEVKGSAQVEWIRDGAHYQVHLDLVVGPSFAPIITRRLTSDGRITAAGLAPTRYDQDTKVVLRDRHLATIVFEAGDVRLANGERRRAPEGLQDTASQFVQLAYLFGTRPELLRAGGVIRMPIALPNKVETWTYDVAGEELLHTPFGKLTSLHLTPRDAQRRSPGDLSAEIWFAPQLRYLPVRIRIEQDPQTFIDLMISKRPELGG